MKTDLVRILIADDNHDHRMLVRTILERAGFAVTTVTCGHAAVGKAAAYEYDVIVLDLKMPGLDGYETAQRLREGGYDKAVVAFTADVMPSVAERCLESGFDACLTKPMPAAALVAKMQEIRDRFSNIQPGSGLSG